MKRTLGFLAVAALLQCAPLVPAAFAGVEEIPTDRELLQAEGTPPVIPHALGGRADCLSCHGLGKGGATICPHPVRIDCMQCHLPTRSGEPTPPKKGRARK